MQINNVLSNPGSPRPLRTPKGDPPPDQPKGDTWCKAGTAGVAALSGAGLGYAGFHGGAVAGGLLGMVLTPANAGIGDPGLLGNVLTGLQVGAVTGALVGAVGGVCLVYLVADLLKSPEA